MRHEGNGKKGHVPKNLNREIIDPESGEYPDAAEKIIKLKQSDDALRRRLIAAGHLGGGYSHEMAELHNRNADILSGIIDKIGFPSTDKVGEEASEAAWLIIQHSIGRPKFMRRCARILESLMQVEKKYHRYYAYLTDRIAVFENSPQRYGTQFDWDEYGELNPNRLDDLTKVKQRRKLIGLYTLEEQTKIMRNRAEREHLSPPPDFKKREKELEEWKKRASGRKH